MLDAYIPSALTTADRYAGAQMKFYLSFTSREQTFFWVFLVMFLTMTPDMTCVGRAPLPTPSLIRDCLDEASILPLRGHEGGGRTAASLTRPCTLPR